MRKFFKATRSLALAALILLLGAAAFPYTMPETEAFAAAYYAPITATSGTELLGQVHDLITETHTHYTSYGDCSTPSLVKQTDPGSSSSYVMEFYSQADIASTWGSGAVGTWTKNTSGVRV